MTIKSSDGHDYHVTGEGQGTYNTIAGSLGLASFLGLNGNGLFNGGMGRSTNGADGTAYVTKSELDYVQEIARKDSEIALLKSEQNTENKIADVYERIMTRVNADRRDQDAVNANQAVYNATSTSAVAVLQNQVASLMSLTKVIVPADNICPQPMPLYNNWKAPAEA